LHCQLFEKRMFIYFRLFKYLILEKRYYGSLKIFFPSKEFFFKILSLWNSAIQILYWCEFLACDILSRRLIIFFLSEQVGKDTVVIQKDTLFLAILFLAKVYNVWWTTTQTLIVEWIQFCRNWTCYDFNICNRSAMPHTNHLSSTDLSTVLSDPLLLW
jgi:hypothetical protein